MAPFPAPQTPPIQNLLPLLLGDRTFRVPHFACKLLPKRYFRRRICTCPPRSAILAAPRCAALRQSIVHPGLRPEARALGHGWAQRRPNSPEPLVHPPRPSDHASRITRHVFGFSRSESGSPCPPGRGPRTPAKHAPRASKAASEPPHSTIRHSLCTRLTPIVGGTSPSRERTILFLLVPTLPGPGAGASRLAPRLA